MNWENTMSDAFEEKVETFSEHFRTEAMTTPSPSVKDRLDLFKQILATIPVPGDKNKSQLLVKTNSEEFWFPLDKSITVGANPDNDLQLKDPCVSGKHCQINQDAAGWKIVDLESSNGVYVNGSRFSKRKLNDGDMINLGNCCLVYAASINDELH